MTAITIKNRDSVYQVPDGLFGLNMEITRKTFFSGLSAQMLNNRKFFAGDEQAPSGWQVCNCRYEKKPENSLCLSNYVVFSEGGSISQTADVISLKQGNSYEISLWVNGSDADRCVQVTIDRYKVEFDVPASQEPYVELKAVVAAEADCCGCSFCISLVRGTAMNLYEASLMPVDHYYGMRIDVIDKLRELKPTHLRFPGGCCADQIDWREGIKPVQCRKPFDGQRISFIFPNTYGQDCHDIGINEFIMLCRAVGAEPEYTVRLVFSDAEEARGIVEYCNGGKDTYWGSVRESLGFSAFGIRNWYIGNEIYYFGEELIANAKESARRTDEYITAMRSVDPSIVCIVSPNPEADRKDWSRDYISSVQSQYEYLSYHRYPGFTKAADTPDAVRSLLRNGYNPELDFIKQELIGSDSTKKIVYDEWNWRWGATGSTLMLLTNAIILQFMLLTSEKYGMTDSRFFHPVNEGMILVTPFDCKLDTSGELFQYFSKHRGGKLMDTTVEGCDMLDVLATEHSSHVVLSIINRGEEEQAITLCDGRATKQEQNVQIHMSGMRANVISEHTNEVEIIDQTVDLGKSIIIPANGIVFLEM